MSDAGRLGGIDLSASQIAGRARWRQSRPALEDGALYPLEQEYSLELPLGYVPPPPAAPPAIAVLLHAFHIDLLAEFRAYLDHIPFSADLFITTDDAAKEPAVSARFAGWTKGTVEIRIVPNRGRDVAPKLVGMADVHDRYQYVLHLHTKQSAHASRLAGWRGYLLDTLLGSPATVRGVFEAFAVAPKLGLLAPQHIDELRPWVRWSANFDLAHGLAARMGFELPRRAPLEFPSGSMFWARTAALRPLLDLRLQPGDFPEESGQTDGTLAHAIERLYCLACEQAGFDWMKIAARGELHEWRGVTRVSDPQALRDFLARRRVGLSAIRHERREIDDAPFITTPSPMPRRVLHVLWRRALGDDLPSVPASRLAVVLPRGADAGGRLAGSVGVALRNLPRDVSAETIENAAGSESGNDSAWRNGALGAGFAAGADLVLLLDSPGLLHPGCAAALVRMSQAHGGNALLEAARFPQAAPKPVDADDFSIDSAAGPALAVPRAVFEHIGGLDERLTGADADADFSRRARASGFAVRHCPRALYLTAGAPWITSTGRTGIDVIVRLYDMSELPRLSHCVFSLMGQSGSGEPLRLHLMFQRFSVAELRQIRAAMEPLRALDETLRVLVHNWAYPEPFDLRVPLLNWGLEVAEGRYVTCIGAADLLFPNALSELLTRLRETEAPIALGGMVTQPVRWWGDVVLPLPSPITPATPIFLLDRTRIAARELAFRSGDPDGEIAELVARIAGAHHASRAVTTEPLGLRQVPL